MKTSKLEPVCIRRRVLFFFPAHAELTAYLWSPLPDQGEGGLEIANATNSNRLYFCSAGLRAGDFVPGAFVR